MATSEPNNWQTTLARAAQGRVAVLCVGNVLCGDDGAGPALAEALHLAEPWAVFDCALAPENWIGPVCRFRPDLVVAVDSMHFAAPPGTIACWARRDLAHLGPSTHRASLAMVLEVLEAETGAASLVVGIQPQCVELGAAMCPPVSASVRELAAALHRLAAIPAGTPASPQR